MNDKRVYSTMHARPRRCAKHLDELSTRMVWLDERGWDKPPVHIVDREADSVAHWRTWSAQGSRFLVRAKDVPRVCFESAPIKPKDQAQGVG